MHISYLLHLYNLFEPYCDSLVRVVEVFNKKTKINHTQMAFKTVSLPLFLKYHKMFYIFDETLKRYTKIVPYNIEDIMTPVVLAHLIMGDGNLKPKDKIIRIYTNSFSKKDVERLGIAITNRLGIVTNTTFDRNNQYMLIISRNQLEKVRSIVLPYMHISMLYKLDLDPNITNCFRYENHLNEI